MEKLWLSRENRAVFCLKTGINNTSPLHERKKKNPMGDHSNSGRYLLRFAAQIFRSATVLRASLPPLRRWAAVSDGAATAPTPQSVRHGLVCLLTFYRFVRSFVQLLTERYSKVMSIPVCSESVREQKYICQSSCDQKESHRLSFFAFFIVKRCHSSASGFATRVLYPPKMVMVG